MKHYIHYIITICSLISCSNSENLVIDDDDDPVPPPPVTNFSTAIVKANQTVSASGKNDIDVIRNYYYSGTVCSDNLTNNAGQQLWPIELRYANMIGVHALRSINGERGSNLDAAGNFVAHANLNSHLNTIHNHQWDLHLVVGQHKPAVFPGDAWNWNAEQWNKYEDYAYKCLRYVMNDYKTGFPEAIVEVENEVDISGTAGRWFVEGKWNNGDLKAYAGYIKLYAEWSDAVKRFNRDFPAKKVKLFGPAVTVYTIWWTPMWCKENWALKLIADAKANNWLLDGISFHQYGAEMLGDRPDYSAGKNPCFKTTIQQMQDKLNSSGFAGTEIWITEWGCSSWVGTERYKNNYRPVGGAFAAAFMHDCIDSGVDGMVPLRLRDPNTDADWSEIGSLATINKVIYPKPVFNVYQMFNMLQGERKKVEWKRGNCQLGAIAAANGNTAGVVVYNYDWDDIHILEKCEPHDVQVKIAGTGFTGQVNVKQYLMDSERSNVAKYVDTNFLPPPVAACELQKVEEYTTQAVQDTITLTVRTLDKSAVSLWLISKTSN